MDEQLRALTQSLAALVDDRRIAVAESCTAGLVSQAVAAGDGASSWYLGGVVAYHREVKYDVLDVPRGPVVNHTSARAMARGVIRLLGADCAVSVTCAAGPDGQDGAEPGTVFVGYSVDGIEDSEEHQFSGNPEEVCVQAARAALAGLVQRLSSDDDQASEAGGAAAASMRMTSSSRT
jgi:nicotinamide-nucleotide amidase